jgi:hypothetical protein
VCLPQRWPGKGGSTSGRRRSRKSREQDSFSANGKTLVGDPYPFAQTVNFVDGVAVDAHGVGVAERVQLPSGGVFIVAGRVDIFNANSAILAVDSGNSGNNLDAFCAALS